MQQVCIRVTDGPTGWAAYPRARGLQGQISSPTFTIKSPIISLRGLRWIYVWHPPLTAESRLRLSIRDRRSRKSSRMIFGRAYRNTTFYSWLSCHNGSGVQTRVVHKWTNESWAYFPGIPALLGCTLLLVGIFGCLLSCRAILKYSFRTPRKMHQNHCTR